MLTYFATVPIKPQHFADAVKAVTAIVPQTRAEAGCQRFDLYCDEDKSLLYIMESWSDQAAFDFHHAQDYTRDVFTAYEEWLAGDVAFLPMQQAA